MYTVMLRCPVGGWRLSYPFSAREPVYHVITWTTAEPTREAAEATVRDLRAGFARGETAWVVDPVE